MLEQTSALWAARVREWRESGETAAQFSSGRGFAAGTLKGWATRLRHAEAAPSTWPRRGRPPTSPAPAAVTPPKSVTLARVVRAEPSATPVTPTRVPIDVLVGDVRVRVEPGADEAALRLVFRALGVAR